MDWVAGLSLGYRLTGNRNFLKIAEKAGRYYYEGIFSKGGKN